MTAQVSSDKRSAVSRLWNNKESRSVMIQIITIGALFALFFYLGVNAYLNLKAIGKDLSFEFLWQPASYDINQTLIDRSVVRIAFRFQGFQKETYAYEVQDGFHACGAERHRRRRLRR